MQQVVHSCDSSSETCMRPLTNANPKQASAAALESMPFSLAHAYPIRNPLQL
jgi:hypothetical protein